MSSNLAFFHLDLSSQLKKLWGCPLESFCRYSVFWILFTRGSMSWEQLVKKWHACHSYGRLLAKSSDGREFAANSSYNIKPWQVQSFERFVLTGCAWQTLCIQGHTVAGYACQLCQPSFRPDGRYVVSGDGKGKVWFWDWTFAKGTGITRPMRLFALTPGGILLENSRVATAGWDGRITYWE